MKAFFQRVAESVMPADSKTVPLTAPPFRSKRKRILLLDDDPSFCDMMRSWCQRFLVDLHVVSTIREARELLAQRLDVFDVLLFDVRLSNGSGIDLYAQIFARSPSTHVVFVTGYDSADVRAKVEAIGPARVYPKTRLTGSFLAGLFAEWGVASSSHA